jgi:short-subunit dehydrogenase
MLGKILTQALLLHTNFMIIRIQRLETVSSLLHVVNNTRLITITYEGDAPKEAELKKQLVDKKLEHVPITMIFHVLGFVPNEEKISSSKLWDINYQTPRIINEVFTPSITNTMKNYIYIKTAYVYVSSIIASFPSAILQYYGNTKSALEYYAMASSHHHPPGTDVAIFKPGVFLSNRTRESGISEKECPRWIVCDANEVVENMLVHLQNNTYCGHWRHVLTYYLYSVMFTFVTFHESVSHACYHLSLFFKK